MNLSYPTPMPKILASTLLAAALLPWSFAVHAAGPAQGQIHFLVLGPAGQAMPGVTLQGSCQSDDGALFGGQKLVSPWSCTADALGVCRADVRLLPRPDSDRANECRATVPTQITEPGAPAHKGSYFTFFADGRTDSYNLLQKGASWKHGDADFQSLPGKEAFDALAQRNDSAYYLARTAVHDDPASGAVLIDTAGAHGQEPPNTAGTAYLQARIDRKTRAVAVRVVFSETYIDYTFHGIDTARYAGAQKVALLEHRQSSTCNLRDLMQRKCSYQEQAAFEIAPEAFRQAAAAYRAGERAPWEFQLLSKSGHERRRAVRPAEFQALAEAVDRAAAGMRP